MNAINTSFVSFIPLKSLFMRNIQTDVSPQPMKNLTYVSMKLFTRNSPYYYLLKLVLFLVKHRVYSLLLQGYKPVQHVSVLNAVGNCNTMVSITILFCSYIILYYVTLRYVMLCYVMLCYVILYYIILYYIILYYIILYY